MRFITLATGAALLALAGTSAQAADPFYVRLDLGASISTNAGGNIYSGTGFGQDFGNSPVFGFGIGKAFMSRDEGFGFRAELETRYRPSFGADHTALNPAGTITLGTSTDVRNWTVMGNLFADYVSGAWRPYVGAGAGGAFNHLNLLNYTFNNVQAATEPGSDKTRFAWSAMAGIGYKMTENATMDIGYKYLDAGKIASSGVVTLANGTTSTQPPVISRLKAHEFTVGVRYAF